MLASIHIGNRLQFTCNGETVIAMVRELWPGGMTLELSNGNLMGILRSQLLEGSPRLIQAPQGRAEDHDC